jgi:ubiquinone/menaquinone biosynthesis C-methylase UbiE
MDADQWNARYAAQELWGAEPNRFVAPLVDELRPGRALDLACGEGRNAIWLARHGWQVTAVDFASVAVDRGRARAKETATDVEWVVADVVSWPMPERAFDLVVIAYLQLPDEERRLVWARASRALAPNGTLFVVGHDTRNVTDGVGGPSDARVCYTAADVVAVVPELEIVEAGEIERPAGDGVAIDCCVRAVYTPAPVRM